LETHGKRVNMAPDDLHKKSTAKPKGEASGGAQSSPANRSVTNFRDTTGGDCRCRFADPKTAGLYRLRALAPSTKAAARMIGFGPVQPRLGGETSLR
jgi:hypothetical protein